MANLPQDVWSPSYSVGGIRGTITSPCGYGGTSAGTRVLPDFAKTDSVDTMTTMNISLPDSLKSFVDDQVGARGYSTSSEYVRELIRRDRDRERFRGLLLEGAESQPAGEANVNYFDRLRDRVRQSGQH